MRWLALILALSSATPALAQRVELPVRQVTLPDGVRRYAVAITINGQPVEAGIDTGSTGLRVVGPRLPGGAALAGPRTHYGYGSGVVYTGPVVKVAVGFGAQAAAPVRVQRIDALSCDKAAPDCAATKLDLAHYGIQGDGLAGQGFPAILGIGMRADEVGNPLVEAGVTRWILELPRAPGDTGRLVLDPAEDEAARYRTVRFIPDTNLVAGCLIAGAKRLCAPAMVDSGANGIVVQGGRRGDIVPRGTPATLVIGDRDASLSMPVTIGRRDQAAGLFLAPARLPGQVSLSLGIAPYLHWSVLYDAKAHLLGLAER